MQAPASLVSHNVSFKEAARSAIKQRSKNVYLIEQSEGHQTRSQRCLNDNIAKWGETMNLGLQGKVAIVTGSSDGIGYATAHVLAQEGVRVVLCARRESLLVEARDTIAKETGADLLAVPCDVQQLPDVQRLVTATMQRFGTIHILVNNAGNVPPHEFIDVDDAKWRQMLEGKLLNYIRVTREIVPYMQKAGWGRIINMAGTAGWEP
jgi:3-oxoacyl-[acyl-carrier protein] reductase